MKDIEYAVCAAFGVAPGALQSQAKHRSLAHARFGAFYLSRFYTDQSLPQIGRYYGDRDHTTVMHGIRRVPDVRKFSTDFEAKLSAAKARLESDAPRKRDYLKMQFAQVADQARKYQIARAPLLEPDLQATG